jgi:hypothetical protein
MKPLKVNCLLMFNSCSWDQGRKSEELQKVRNWFLPQVEITFFQTDTNFKDIKWIDGAIESAYNVGMSTGKIIDPKDYDAKFTRTSLGWGWRNNTPIDICAAVLDTPEWKGGIIQGARCDSEQGSVETYILAGSERAGLFSEGKMIATSLYSILIHELSHAMSTLTGVPDRTHSLLKMPLNIPSENIKMDFIPTPTFTYNKAYFRTLRNFWRKVWNLWS